MADHVQHSTTGEYQQLPADTGVPFKRKLDGVPKLDHSRHKYTSPPALATGSKNQNSQTAQN
jgi:hypothetical protein